MKIYSLIIALLFFSTNVFGSASAIIVHEASIHASHQKPQPPSPITRKLIQELKKWDANTSLSLADLEPLDNNDILIAVGGRALENLITTDVPNPIIATFISKTTFNNIMARHSSRPSQKHPRNVTAIFSDPDPLKQLLLFSELYGSQKSIGIIRTQESHELVSEYTALAHTIGIEVTDIHIDALDNAKELVRQFKQDHSILLLRDKTLFNKMSVEEILLKAYNFSEKGIIVYSGELVKRGGLATTYSSLSDIVRTIKIYVALIRKNGVLPKADHTPFFSLAINQYLARSLNISIDHHQKIKDRIEKQINQNKKQATKNILKPFQGRNNDES